MKKILFYIALPFFVVIYSLYVFLKNMIPSVRVRQNNIISSILRILAKNGKTEEADLFQLVRKDIQETISQDEFLRFLRLLERNGYIVNKHEICTCESCTLMFLNFRSCTIRSYWEITLVGKNRRISMTETEHEEGSGGLLPSPA